MPADPDAVEYPRARTFAEAELFVAMQPCAACDENALEVQGFSTGDVDGRPVRLFQVVCAHCSAQRRFWFRFPVAAEERATSRFRYGGDQPSELLDPGQWMMFADYLLADVPDSPIGLDAGRRQQVRDNLDVAVSALEEVLKFLGADEDRISGLAFWSQPGFEMQQSAAWRFERQWLESQLTVCRRTRAAFSDR